MPRKTITVLLFIRAALMLWHVPCCGLCSPAYSCCANEVDLDAAAVMFDAYGQVIDAVFYNQMQALGGVMPMLFSAPPTVAGPLDSPSPPMPTCAVGAGGAVTHSGDCRNGEIVGDDEVSAAPNCDGDDDGRASAATTVSTDYHGWMHMQWQDVQ